MRPPTIPAAVRRSRRGSTNNLAKVVFHLPPFIAFDSRHNPSSCSTVSRKAAGRGCLWAQGHRNLEKVVFHLPPFIAFDSRHNLSSCSTVSREAAGRVRGIGLLFCPYI